MHVFATCACCCELQEHKLMRPCLHLKQRGTSFQMQQTNKYDTTSVKYRHTEFDIKYIYIYLSYIYIYICRLKHSA